MFSLSTLIGPKAVSGKRISARSGPFSQNCQGQSTEQCFTWKSLYLFSFGAIVYQFQICCISFCQCSLENCCTSVLTSYNAFKLPVKQFF